MATTRGRAGRRGRRLAAAAVLLLAGGCGYHLSGRGGGLPGQARRISVPLFENQTEQPDIAQRITESVTDEFIRRGGAVLASSPDSADAVLRGTVAAYLALPVGIGADGRATRYEIVVQVKAVLRDVRDDRVLWQDDHYVFRRQYDMSESEQNSFDQSIVAIEGVARDVARSMVAAIVEGF